MDPEVLLSFREGKTQKEGKKKVVGSEGGRVMRGQPPSTVEPPEPERNANFMVNWSPHLDW